MRQDMAKMDANNFYELFSRVPEPLHAYPSRACRTAHAAEDILTIHASLLLSGPEQYHP